MRRNTLREDASHSLFAGVNTGGGEMPHPPPPGASPIEHEYDVYVESDRITFIKKTPGDNDAADGKTVPAASEQDAAPTPSPFLFLLHGFLLLCAFLCLDSADMLFTPTVTLTLLPVVRSVTLRGVLPLGRILESLTLSESKTVPATGHGHQDAAAARGTVTFYNGLFTPQFIARGTVFIGRDGVSIAMAQPTTVPSGNPATGYGTATVATQALQQGSAGNIAAGDITVTVRNGLLVSNSPFAGGQDARDYTVVAEADIATAAATLKAQLAASMAAALHGQLLKGEQMQALPCAPTVATDRAAWQEASQVQVTVSETCQAVAYDRRELVSQVAKLLASRAMKALGQGYARYGDVSVTVTQATAQAQAATLAFLAQGTWVYQIDPASVTRLVRGQPRLTALRMLTRLAGVARASISGVEGDQELPIDPAHIRLLMLV
jgi:hypothetical protein